MIGAVHDFENLTLTNFPTTFEQSLTELVQTSVLLLVQEVIVDLIVHFFRSFSENKIRTYLNCLSKNNCILEEMKKKICILIAQIPMF